VSELTELERRVVEAVAERREEIVALACDLVSLDTTAREPGDPPRDEVALQELLATRLESVGAAVDLFEPDAEALAGRPLVPPGLDFAGRPQLIARLPGVGGGRALVLNGHIDVVPAGAADGWTSPPFAPEVRDGLLFGRGSCDMKGGIAAMTVAAEVLADLGALAGDLVVATNTDEESSGAGGTALVARGLRADAAIVTEPTGLEVWTCCRGSTYATVTVEGRAGHTEIPQPPWRDGGAVNAIEKAVVVIDALRALRERWATDPALTHPALSRPDALVTVVRAGDWAVTIPGSCSLVLGALFLPAQAAADGFAGDVEQEVEAWVTRVCGERDDWLAAHPPRFHWEPQAVMPYEIAADEPIVAATEGALRALGVEPRRSGLDSWFDAATFSVLGGVPAIGLGPSGLGRDGVPVAHTVDEHVPVDDLVRTAQALAVAALRFCGVAT
jgi:acetylornithine deacetylase